MAVSVRVVIPSPLRSYTGGRALVESSGNSLLELLSSLDRDYPGIRFRIVDEQDRIRTHIKFFVGEEMARTLSHAVAPGEEVQIVCALSGG